MGETRMLQEERPAHLLASMREVEASLEHDVSRSPRASGLHTEMENLRRQGRIGHNKQGDGHSPAIVGPDNPQSLGSRAVESHCVPLTAIHCHHIRAASACRNPHDFCHPGIHIWSYAHLQMFCMNLNGPNM